MKLIDILVEELPKRGGWPEGVVAITQDSDKAINNYKTADGLETNENGTWRYSSAWEGYSLLASDSPCLASDYDTAIITRDQYETALDTKNEGWVEWGGGKFPPVSTNTIVDVKFKKGYVQVGYPAGQYSWEHNWQGSNIIAYRLHQPQKVAHTEAEQEAYLNECIGQATATEWNGEGLPPVGCECEWQDKNTKQWNPVKVVYASEWVTVIREINKEKGDDLVEIAIENYGDDARLKFRPIRSAEDEKRDDRASAIDGFISGFRGQEAGSNKELAYALTDYLALLDKI